MYLPTSMCSSYIVCFECQLYYLCIYLILSDCMPLGNMLTLEQSELRHYLSIVHSEMLELLITLYVCYSHVTNIYSSCVLHSCTKQCCSP